MDHSLVSFISVYHLLVNYFENNSLNFLTILSIGGFKI